LIFMRLIGPRRAIQVLSRADTDYGVGGEADVAPGIADALAQDDAVGADP
jgi:hypothetical protein